MSAFSTRTAVAAAVVAAMLAQRALAAGRYAVRAGSLKLDQSVEVPFDVQARSRQSRRRLRHPRLRLPLPPPRFSPAKVDDAGSDVAAISQDSDADAVVDELKRELLSRGDNLWRISRKRLGHGTRVIEIYAANAKQIRIPSWSIQVKCLCCLAKASSGHLLRLSSSHLNTTGRGSAPAWNRG